MRPDAPVARNPPGEGTAGRLRRLGRASADLLRLELKVVSGNRLLVLLAVEALVFVVFGLFVWFGDPEWTTESFYNRTVLVPSLLPAIVLSMAAVLGDRDSRQLEVTFVSPGGRYQVWLFRHAAIFGVSALVTAALSLATWATLDHDFAPALAAVHALVPLAFIVSLTALWGVLFRSSAVAGLLTVGVIVASALFLHGTGWLSIVDMFFNPLVVPADLIDPMTWVRRVFWNRVCLSALAALAAGLALGLLQRRERLL